MHTCRNTLLHVCSIATHRLGSIHVGVHSWIQLVQQVAVVWACGLGRGAGTWGLFESAATRSCGSTSTSMNASSDASSRTASVNARSDTRPIARRAASVGSLAVCLGCAHISGSVHVGIHSWVELVENGGVVQRSARGCSCVCSRGISNVSGAGARVNPWVSSVGNAGRMRASAGGLGSASWLGARDACVTGCGILIGHFEGCGI